MRRVSIAAAAVLAVTTGGGALAQHAGGHMPGAMPHPMPPMSGHPMPGRPMPGAGGQWHGAHSGNWRGQRWGNRIGGHWWGGVRAPGGWGAYRRPYRGWVLPSYWVAPGWGVTDWSWYNLPAPPTGYNWSRYYDDAVLIDGRGSVYDSVPDVDWDGERGGYADGGYAGAGYPPPPPPPPSRNDGVGGALAGGAVGAVAGAAIAGHGNRLGGALIGGGVGALAGQAIDRSSRRDRYDRRYGADYPPPSPFYGGGYPPPPPPPPYMGGYATEPYGPAVVHAGPGTTVTTTTTAGPAGVIVGGWYYPPTTVTTVTINSAPVTTTEVVYEKRVWRPVHHAWHRPVVRRKEYCCRK